MQIVSEALFERLRQTPLLHTSTHNLIAYTTASELILRQITIEAKCQQLKIKGNQIISICLENPNFIVTLSKSGLLQVRKIDLLSQIILSAHIVLAKDAIPKVRVSSNTIYVLNKYYVETISLNKQKGRRKVYLQDKKQIPQDILISTIFEEQVILFQFPNSISLTTQDKIIAQAPFDQVSVFKLLKNPTLVDESKEFLALIEQKKTLKVFDIYDMEIIIEMELFVQQNQEIQLKVDPLNEYMMIHIYDRISRATIRNSLLKINQEYYKGYAKQPFFLFDVELCLKHDFILFPIHIQVIQGAEFYSIDMCFFSQKQIRIATLVIDINHRTKLQHAKYDTKTWVCNTSWKDFFPNTTDIHSNIHKKPEIQYQTPENDDEWEKFISKFYEENLQKLKCQGLFRGIQKHNEPKKYIQYQTTRHQKDAHDYEDALNTLSGSSSFGSLKQIAPELSFKQLKFFQEENLSSQQQSPRQRQSNKSDNESVDCEYSPQEQYLDTINQEITQRFTPISHRTQTLDQKIDRLEQVHIRKLKNMQDNIKRHTKEVTNIQKNISKWCGQEMKIFSNDIKQTMKKYSSMLGRLQMVEIRHVKKLKKHYRDFIQDQIERCEQNFEQNQKIVSQIQLIARVQERLSK